jgi:short-subunit dehydrogenase
MHRMSAIVITGASSGIGLATAELLAAQGASLLLVARNAERLKQVADRLGENAHYIAADMTRRDEVKRTVARAIADLGHVDVWINNVGLGISRAPTQLTESDIDAMVKFNVKTALYGMQEIMPHFKARGRGQIINMSSMLGRIPRVPQRAAYTAAKHYLNALTINFRHEIQQTHPDIKFTIVSPGVVYTDFGKSAMYGGPDSRSLPEGQEPIEVARVIAAAIESRAEDVYTRKGSHEQVVKFYDSLGTDP